MIERQDDDGIVTLRLAHGSASALDVELLEALSGSLDDLEGSEASALILTGTGRIFSAGVDLFRLVDEGASYVDRFFPLLSSTFQRLFLFPLPVVAAANGHAIAGGCILVESSDYRLMAAGKGRIGMPELLVGVSFPALILEIVRHSVAPQYLQHLVYSGQTFGQDEALTRGLVDEVVSGDDLMSRAGSVARQFAANPEGFRLAKMQLRRDVVKRAASFAGADLESLELWRSKETHARIRAYLEETVGRKSG